MKKINLKGVSEILSEKELKNVMGGGFSCYRDNGETYGEFHHNTSVGMAVAWMEAWSSLGYTVRCYGN